VPGVGSLIVVSACDSGYLPLFQDLLASLRRHHPGTAVGLLDLGLSEPEAAALRGDGVTVVRPGWDLPDELLARFPWPDKYRAMTARPYLPRYFPGHDILIWLDSDVWLCGPRALPLLQAAAGQRDIAIIPALDRSDRNHYGSGALQHRLQMLQVLRTLLPEPQAQALTVAAEFNSGVFAMRAGSPLWAPWAAAVEQVVRHVADSGATLYHVFEQVALNVVLHGVDPARLALLPMRFNWPVGAALPLLDQAAGRLREPNPPYDPIEILHLIHSGVGAAAKGAPLDLPTVAGTVVRTPLTYAALGQRLEG
jgi:hypothetical protein